MNLLIRYISLIHKKKQLVLYIAVTIFISVLCKDTKVYGQFSQNFSYEEVSIGFHVPRIGNQEIPAIIQGQTVFLSFSAVFDFLRLKNTVSLNQDSIYGFFIHPKSKYLVEPELNRIIYEDIIFNLQPNSLLKTETDIYLRSDYFGEIFDLECIFSFRSLSVSLNTKVELPAIREMQQEQMRKNINVLKNKVIADTVIPASRRSLRFGMADLGVYSLIESNGYSNTRVNLNIGANIMGGEATALLWYTANEPLDKRQQFYRWRLVNNKSKIVRQFNVGRVYTQATSSLFAPINGVQISNTPTTYRKSFGTYRLNYKIEPEWTVELYVNNILINYTKSDASGFLSFDVPLMYGNTIVTLRAYGPYGEERIKEEIINIPFNFLPVNEFEYTISAGIVDDANRSKFTRANFNYGITKTMTVGAGVEYLSSVDPRSVMPFVNASVRFGKRILASAEHTNGVRSKAFLTYRLPSSFQLELDYTKYEKDQTAVNVNFNEERKVGVSYLFRTKKVVGFTKLGLSQQLFHKNKQIIGEWIISGVVAGVGANITTNGALLNDYNSYINSNLSLTFRLPSAIRFTPQIRYDFREKSITSIRAEVEKRVLKNGYATLGYQTGPADGGTAYTVGFRYNFSFAQVSTLFRKQEDKMFSNISFRGSLLYDDNINTMRFREQSSIGRGAITIIPFLDLNANGKRDKNETKVAGLKLHLTGGRVERNNKDTSIHVLGLEPYNDYVIQLSKTSFDNVAWQIKNPNIKVTIEPNHFKVIEVPVSVVGEVAGTVFLQKNKQPSGQGRILVNIFKDDSVFVAKTLSEPDGYFSYLGLLPGNYTAAIDADQLQKLNFCCPQVVPFTIKKDINGDVVDGLEFVIVSNDTIESNLNMNVENNIPVNEAIGNTKDKNVKTELINKDNFSTDLSKTNKKQLLTKDNELATKNKMKVSANSRTKQSTKTIKNHKQESHTATKHKSSTVTKTVSKANKNIRQENKIILRSDFMPGRYEAGKERKPTEYLKKYMELLKK